MQRRLLVVIAALLPLIGACKSAPLDKPLAMGPVDTGPGTITQARQYLQGRWVLVSMDLYPPDRPAIHAAATGTLTYDGFGNMDVEMHLSPETTELAGEIGIRAPGGVLSTKGRTVIDVGNHAISYVLEGQAPLRQAMSPLDLNRPRYWETAGNVLTLRTKDDNGTVLSVSVWRKQ
jgi:hypothetical protein